MFGNGCFLGYGLGGNIVGIILIVGILAVLGFVLFNKKESLVKVKSNESPIDILNKRLASGEITEEEYKKIKKELTE
ncbi:MAG TPA: SHOCT domain-containing protein [Candidatus Mcinerneyibacterium sp.]|nr:SHOCT domain-containing protein [Candidatus Mcinerneyibacterium sp.]